MQAVLDNWRDACRRHLHTPAVRLPWIIFYDEAAAWHVNPEEGRLPPHEASATRLRFAGREYPLSRVVHDKGLWVPDRAPLPVEPRATAMVYANEQKPFIIIPLPSLFRKLAAADQAPILDEFFLGLSLHELTHTRQIVYAMRQIKRLRKQYRLPESLDDNMIESRFAGDEAYKRLFDEEQQHLSRAVLADKTDVCRRELAQVLAISRQRRARFFVGDRAGWAGLEDVFLALEGSAMWVQYQVTKDHAPKGQDWRQTLRWLAERMDAWSQQEGLGLFLVIDRLAAGWQACFLGPNMPSPFAVLRRVMREGASSKSSRHRFSCPSPSDWSE